MRKLAILSVLATVALVSCGGGKSAEEQTADSARQADSIAAVQAAAEAARLDSIRLDSIRQDSIEKANAFAFSLPNPKTLLSKSHKGRGSYLSSLGFKGNVKYTPENEFGEAYSDGNYTLTGANGENCKITWSEEFNGTDIKVTINGDENALNDFFIKARKMKSAGMESGTDITKSGNTVTISWFGA